MANYNQPWNPGSTFQNTYMSQMSPYQTTNQTYQGISNVVPAPMQTPLTPTAGCNNYYGGCGCGNSNIYGTV